MAGLFAQLLIFLVNGPVDSEEKPDASVDVKGPKSADRTPSWIVIASTIAIFVGTLISYDLSDALLADFRRTEVLELLKPGMSLTDAKTKVKAAGYFAHIVRRRQPLWILLKTRKSYIYEFAIDGYVTHNLEMFKPILFWFSQRTTLIVEGTSDGKVAANSDGSVRTH